MGVIIICAFGFGVVFSVCGSFVLKGASATVLDVAAWGKVREKKSGCEVENTPTIGGKREGKFWRDTVGRAWGFRADFERESSGCWLSMQE